jgi:hypothetical protein
VLSHWTILRSRTDACKWPFLPVQPLLTPTDPGPRADSRARAWGSSATSQRR